MKEKLYEIPVNDAFSEDCECPICAIYNKLESESVDYSMGPSYMEDDIRMKTDEMGFCNKHMKMVYDKENRLGMALIFSTHMTKINKEMNEIIDKGGSKPQTKSTLFKKADPNTIDIVRYIDELENRCFICDRIKNFYDRYIQTIFYLYKTSDSFKQTYRKTKGFCLEHYKLLISEANRSLSGSVLDEFLETTNKLFTDNMQRVYEDIDWFIKKFDYKYQNEPWKNSKDSVSRAMIKLNGNK